MADCAGEGNSNQVKSEISSENQNRINCKLDWYQTETHVVLSVFAKNVPSDKLTINFNNAEIFVKFFLDNGSMYEKTVLLLHEIEPEKSSYKVLSSKIEMKLAKKVGLYWTSLEKEMKEEAKKTGRDWDKVVSEIEDEKLDGEPALNALFQKIYSEGSDEVKKAMNKSFLESGGTELNTNWDAVSKKTLDVKPPQGMEWKTWDK